MDFIFPPTLLIEIGTFLSSECHFGISLLFSLYLRHGFCSESEQPEGNRVKQFHLFDLIILASPSELCFNRHYTTQNPVGVSLFTSVCYDGEFIWDIFAEVLICIVLSDVT